VLRALTLLALLPTAALAQSPAAPPAASSAASSAAVLTDAQLMALGRQLTDWMYMGQVDSIYAHMAPETVERKDQATFDNERLQILARIGGETKVVEDKMTMRKGNRQYWRESMVENDVGESIVLRWVFNPQGQVIGVGISPKSSAPAPE
jgi:hypothetical protein